MKSRAPQLSSENRYYKMLSPSGIKIELFYAKHYSFGSDFVLRYKLNLAIQVHKHNVHFLYNWQPSETQDILTKEKVTDRETSIE